MKIKKHASILLVEDDHDIRVAVRQALESAHYEVFSAPNGADALKILNRKIPDLIILDMVMPLMDGNEFLQAKEKDTRFKEIPVILISAFEDRLKVIEQGEMRLSKPLDLDLFLQKIPTILAKKLDNV